MDALEYHVKTSDIFTASVKAALQEDFRKELSEDKDFQLNLVKSLCNSISFMTALPVFPELPEVGMDNDGQIYFEWDRARGYSVTVSIGEKLYYAAIIGELRAKGQEEIPRKYQNQQFPKSISELVHNLYAQNVDPEKIEKDFQEKFSRQYRQV